MTQKNNRIRQPYPMDNLPVSWHTDSDFIVSTAHINDYFPSEIVSPWSGVKKSGIDRERGLETLANYTRVKNVVINIGR